MITFANSLDPDQVTNDLSAIHQRRHWGSKINLNHLSQAELNFKFYGRYMYHIEKHVGLWNLGTFTVSSVSSLLLSQTMEDYEDEV